MRIAVYGSGGVGGYFGGRLAQIGQDVTFIARNESLKELRSNGLKVGSIAGDFSIDKIAVTNNPAEVGIVDYVLCCVKSWQVPAAAKAIKPMIGPVPWSFRCKTASKRLTSWPRNSIPKSCWAECAPSLHSWRARGTSSTAAPTR